MEAQRWTTLGERHRQEQRLALQILTDHPLDYVRSSWPKALLMTLGTTSVAPQVETTFGVGMPQDFVVAVMFLTVYAAACLGAVRLWRSDKAFTIVALIVLVYLVALSFGPEVYERFRVPWWPYVALLAGGVTVRPSATEAHPAETTDTSG